MDEVTKLTLLTLIVAVLALITTIMTVQKGRLILLLQIILTLITSYGFLELYYWWKGEKLHIWALEEYDPESLIMFYKIMLTKIFWCSVVSTILFYVFLRILIAKIFHNKIRNFYSKLFKQDANALNSLEEWYEKAASVRKIFKPKEEPKQYDRSRDKEFENDLIDANSKLTTSIHFIVSLVIIDIPYKLIWYPIIFILLLALIVSKPLMRAIVDHQFPENPTPPTL